MLHLVLSGDEAGTLAATLEQELSDLSCEISSTDSLDYRTMLRHKQTNLRKILESLTATRQQV